MERTANDDDLESCSFFNLADLENLRTDPSKSEYFELMMKQFFPVIYGRLRWNELVDEKPISDFFHPSSEAFVYLVLENNYDYWLRWIKQL
jgi:hypothetical protein